MRYSIIGQSNSILSYGYASQLERMEGLRLVRKGAIGASPSILCPYFAQPGFFAETDFCIIDPLVIDQGNYWRASYDMYAAAQYIEYALHMARSEGCIPIILLIYPRSGVPTDPKLVTPTSSLFYRAIALRNGCAVLDTMPALRALRHEGEAGFNAAYVDANHPNELVSRRIAEALAGFMRNYRSVGALPLERSLVAQPQFANVPLPDVRPVERSSSVLSRRFQDLRVGDVVEVTVGEGIVHGLLINYGSKRSANLRISGETTVVKALGDTKDQGRDYVAQLVPLLDPVRAKDGKAVLKIERPDIAATENSIHQFTALGEAIEVAELIVERAPRILDYDAPRVPPELANIPFGLTGSVPSSEALEMLQSGY